MPNIKSAEKRLRQSAVRQARNMPVRTRARSAVKAAATAIVEGSADRGEAIRQAVSALDRAAQKGIIHPNAAARRKSRLMRRANAG
ncbi:MAG: 30S ribosomal protein S20 [Dehalococcoidia bacterium]|nr:30S ribosomal protein S20 [Dehalococcoidia bacterium]